MIEALQSLFKGSEDTQDFITIKSSANFHIQPVVRGRLPYQSATVIITGYLDRNATQAIDIKCRWYRLVGDRYYEIPNNEDESYHINPFDIGSYIIAIAKPVDQSIRGKSQIKIGPIKMDPSLRPGIEECVISSRGLFNFRLLKIDQKFIDDYSDYENMLFFEKPSIVFKWCEIMKEEMEDFELNMEGTPDFRIKCENHDSRAITIYFRRGFEDKSSKEIDIASPFKSGANSQERKLFDESEEENYPQVANPLNEESNYEEGESTFRSRNKIFDLSPAERQAFNKNQEEEGDLKSLRLRFESRMLRDTFIVSLRILRVLRSVSVSTLLYNVDRVLKKEWFPIGESTFDDDFEMVLFELDTFRETVKRMIEVNKGLTYENDNLNDCIEILENDLEFSVKEFTELLSDLRNRDLDVQEYEDVQEKLMEKSQMAEKMKEERIRPENRGERRKRNLDVESELENTKKLNVMLLKEIDSLKTKKKRQRKEKGMDSNKSFVPTSAREKANRDKLNRSQVEGKKNNENILLGLEEELKKERDEIQGIEEKRKDGALEDHEVQYEEMSEDEEEPKDEENSEEDLLKEALGNLEKSQVDIGGEKKGKGQNQQPPSYNPFLQENKNDSEINKKQENDEKLEEKDKEIETLRVDLKNYKEREQEFLDIMLRCLESENNQKSLEETVNLLQNLELDEKIVKGLTSEENLDKAQKVLISKEISTLRARLKILETYKNQDNHENSPKSKSRKQSYNKDNQSYDVEVLNERIEVLEEKNSSLKDEKKSLQSKIEVLHNELERQYKVKALDQKPESDKVTELEKMIKELSEELQNVKEENTKLKIKKDNEDNNGSQIHLSKEMSGVEDVDLIQSSI